MPKILNRKSRNCYGVPINFLFYFIAKMLQVALIRNNELFCDNILTFLLFVYNQHTLLSNNKIKKATTNFIYF